MRSFSITQGATLPYLELEPISDGRNSFEKLYMAIQGADVTFSMVEVKTGIKKIANAKAYVVEEYNPNGCDTRFKIQYRWDKYDTKDKGEYKGTFRLRFSDDIMVEGITFPKGDLIVPIEEELRIIVI